MSFPFQEGNNCIISSLSFKLFSNESDLGNVCQDMWNSAGDNLKIGQEIVIYTGSKPHPLITLTKLGKKKLQRNIFTRFKGSVSLTFDSWCFYLNFAKIK